MKKTSLLILGLILGISLVFASQITTTIPNGFIQDLLSFQNSTINSTGHITLVHGNESELNTSLYSQMILGYHFNKESWRNEGNSTFFNDSSNNNHNGLCTGSNCPIIEFNESSNSGGIQGFVSFNTTQNITIQDTVGVGQNFTVIALVNTRASISQACIICNRYTTGASNSNGFSFEMNSLAPTLRIVVANGTNVAPAGSAIMADRWAFIAGTVNFSNNAMNATMWYQTPRGLNSISVLGGINATNFDGIGINPIMIIGSRNATTTSAFNGFIDELYIINRTLDKWELDSIYQRMKNKYPENATYTSRIFNLNSSQAFKNITFNGTGIFPKSLQKEDFLPTDTLAIFKFENQSSLGENESQIRDAITTTRGGHCNLGQSSINTSRCPAGSVGIDKFAKNFNGTQYYRLDDENLTGINYNNATSFTIGIIFKPEPYPIPSSTDKMIFSYSDQNNVAGRNRLAITGANNNLESILGGDTLTCSTSVNSMSIEAGYHFNSSRWHFVAVTFNATDQNRSIYIISRVQAEMISNSFCTDIVGGGFNSSHKMMFIGIANPNAPNNDGFKGQIDTMFFVNRTLQATELQKLYDNSLADAKLQIRSCDDSACVGESFVGKDGTSNTYFDNMSYLYPLNNSIIANNSFFQWRLIQNSYDRLQTSDIHIVDVGYDNQTTVSASNIAPNISSATLNYTNSTLFTSSSNINASFNFNDDNSGDKANATIILFVNRRINLTQSLNNNYVANGSISYVFTVSNLVANDVVNAQFNITDGTSASNLTNSTAITVQAIASTTGASPSGQRARPSTLSDLKEKVEDITEEIKKEALNLISFAFGYILEISIFIVCAVIVIILFIKNAKANKKAKKKDFLDTL